MTSPPWLRWFAAAAIVLLAAYLDLRPPSGMDYPFAVDPAEPGQAVAVEWRTVPDGLLPSAESNLKGAAARRIGAGDPLVDGSLRAGPVAPADWWAVPAALPVGADVGSQVLIVVHNPPTQTLGVVVRSGSVGGFGNESDGLVAVSPDAAAAVAIALAAQQATVLVEP